MTNSNGGVYRMTVCLSLNLETKSVFSLSNIIQIVSVFMSLNVFPVKATDNIILKLSVNAL